MHAAVDDLRSGHALVQMRRISAPVSRRNSPRTDGHRRATTAGEENQVHEHLATIARKDRIESSLRRRSPSILPAGTPRRVRKLQAYLAERPTGTHLSQPCERSLRTPVRQARYR